jgi:lipopolysaccharide transport system ATP-binding protein
VKPILEVQNVSKRFRLHHSRLPYQTFRDRISNLFKSNPTEEFWALQDVSFNVARGESIGIIGRNGAGKSTLLKVLSRITPPTQGRIVRRGRIASLLEVGTGFHQELTGEENIYMNGSILGMNRAEIKSKFEDIVEFSGVRNFLDTPLKHYSSGMQLRLAFAVAAHLEPEIMIIDEVLAVGDQEFQAKCLGKMEDVRNEGRTILFVSHNAGAVRKLCRNAILLKAGTIEMQGAAGEVLSYYNSGIHTSATTTFDHPIIKAAMAEVADSKIEIHVDYDYDHTNPLHIGFVITDEFGSKICGSNPKFSDFLLPAKVGKKGRIVTVLNSPKLRPGTYNITLWAGDGFKDFFQAEDCLLLKVTNMLDAKINPDTSVVGPVIPEVYWEYR